MEELRTLTFQGKISIAREISKHFEQLRTGSLDELEIMLREGTMSVKGEFVVGIVP
ncbi:MAG: hypothetical protein LBP53_00620 [Candidatus Peribacteria bacterium]|jgi:16S rRNA C1402 (ribose-2'-O) methylase RsmI|nr:hypothetical protein [Candidatus Peribacteria bacterium]